MQNVANTIQEWIASESAEQPLLLISSSKKTLNTLIGSAKLSLATTEAHRKQIASGNHPDVITIIAEKGRIYIKDIEAFKPRLANKTAKRLVCIPHADTILPDAAGALLKILEEPSISTRFLLGATSKRGILPTIRSRCRIVFAGMDIEEHEQINVQAVLTRLSGLRKAEPFSDEELDEVASLIHELARQDIASLALLTVSQRLRDYYKTASVPGGNTKLAADILLASLANLRNTISYANHTS